eukprot:2692867-Prymnesium_polylepis.2
MSGATKLSSESAWRRGGGVFESPKSIHAHVTRTPCKKTSSLPHHIEDKAQTCAHFAKQIPGNGASPRHAYTTSNLRAGAHMQSERWSSRHEGDPSGPPGPRPNERERGHSVHPNESTPTMKWKNMRIDESPIIRAHLSWSTPVTVDLLTTASVSRRVSVSRHAGPSHCHRPDPEGKSCLGTGGGGGRERGGRGHSGGCCCRLSAGEATWRWRGWRGCEGGGGDVGGEIGSKSMQKSHALHCVVKANTGDGPSAHGRH